MTTIQMTTEKPRVVVVMMIGDSDADSGRDGDSAAAVSFNEFWPTDRGQREICVEGSVRPRCQHHTAMHACRFSSLIQHRYGGDVDSSAALS